MTERAPILWTPERLRENAERQLAEMLVISDELDEAARPDGWTHLLQDVRETHDGSFSALIWSKRAGLTYEVTPSSCWCRQWTAYHQHCPDGGHCKHGLFIFAGGEVPRADLPVSIIWLPSPEELPAREQAAAAAVAATFGGL